MISDGILLLDKPKGLSSFGVVARIRRVLSENAGKKVKVGHTGTLDPFATGLLILVIGNECKNAQHYSGLGKSYEATIVLGVESSTLDPEGELSYRSDHVPSLEDIKLSIDKFKGEIIQTPPAFSAIKVGGKRAYELARQGKDVEIPSRSVTVHKLTVDEYKYPHLKITATVSSGTYIRTLAQDIGNDLGVGAYCLDLRRTEVGDYSIESAKTLEHYGITS